MMNLRFGDVSEFTSGVPKPLRLLVRASLRSCWSVIPITEPMAEVIEKMGGMRVEVIPNFIDIRCPAITRSVNSETGELRIVVRGLDSSCKRRGRVA